VDDPLCRGRIDKRSLLGGEDFVVAFPPHEAVAVWELLKQAFGGKCIAARARRHPG
jgi:hypothetical protein